MKSGQRISRFFDFHAQDVDAIYGTGNSFMNRLINRFLRKSMKIRYEKTIAGCDSVEGRTVFDVGCGPGVTMYIEKIARDYFVTASVESPGSSK